jgi:uncharacterized protein (TIGR02246 family)
MALLVGGVAAVSVRAQATPDAEFKKIADAFSDAWAKGDGKAMAALYTKDAVRMSGAGEPAVVGTAAIENAMTTVLTGPMKGTKLVITPGKNYRVTADTYIGEGTYEVTGGAPPAGTATRGQYMNTLVRQGGRWLIAGSAVMPATTAK